MMRAAAIAVVVVAAGALSAGCAGDECREDESICIDDSTIRWCSTDSHEWREPEPCQALNPFCVTLDQLSGLPSQTKGYCASLPGKVASCAMTSDDYCSEEARYACLDGYSVFEEACANGCSGNKCAP